MKILINYDQSTKFLIVQTSKSTIKLIESTIKLIVNKKNTPVNDLNQLYTSVLFKGGKHIVGYALK